MGKERIVPKKPTQEEMKEIKKAIKKFKKSGGDLLEWLADLLGIELEEGGPKCAKHLIRTEDVIIVKDNIYIGNDGTISINNTELYNAARAVKDEEEGACNVVIQFHLRHPDVSGALGYTSLDGPGGHETPPPLVSVCSD
jgi:hypothetical protein